MESSSSKKYGLIVPKKLSDLPKKITNVFGDDSDSENETSKKRIQTNNQTKAQQRSAKLSIDKALKEDATVFQYDEVYDDMEKKKEHNNEKKKNVKPRYIQNLLVQAEKRKVEYERRNERLIQKEREAEGDEFKDKEAFVTASYKAKLEELRKLDEEDLKFSMIEDINDVTKQKDMGSFYRHLFKQELCKNENDKIDEVKKPTKKSDASRQYRKRASSNTSDDDNANDDKDTDLSDSDSSVDSKRRKIEIHDYKKSVGENADEPEVKLKESTIEIAKVKNTAPNEEPKTPVEVTKEIPKDKKTEKNESKPKEIKPKINIWLKRTVGNVFEEARQRYFQRQITNLQCVRT
ncbi:nuclear speckle splicing regulatory protein 1 [Acyrthosiphon pisum]|uniref:Nuclear speckle splicing regulatory protein 1 N-terminal domain-containing protein n=1 Tax=Acyrthosiphon pisum TaxID=7029 RepID=A0A8R2A7G6_ACYPI|nr:nuclear speckle splicing regulatory protein 1 [Acyrthosiphon pisum]|eukprot:XP_001949043.2 PREDICTED: nuclear speckle splicing regulatory protein 1 [Acyrthosiphon pisum]